MIQRLAQDAPRDVERLGVVQRLLLKRQQAAAWIGVRGAFAHFGHTLRRAELIEALRIDFELETVTDGRQQPLLEYAQRRLGRSVHAQAPQRLRIVFEELGLRIVPGSYFTSRMQNLLWSRTGTALLRFGSELRFWPVFTLTLKNWLLLLLSLGLYWPFAMVAVARLRLEAVSFELDVEGQALVETAVASEGEAAGDAAGDLFGLDIGL